MIKEMFENLLDPERKNVKIHICFQLVWSKPSVLLAQEPTSLGSIGQISGGGGGVDETAPNIVPPPSPIFLSPLILLPLMLKGFV